MTLVTLTQSSDETQEKQFVYEYSFTVLNVQQQDTQELTASFIGIPSQREWSEWLKGWNSIDYELNSTPQVIGIF